MPTLLDRIVGPLTEDMDGDGTRGIVALRSATEFQARLDEVAEKTNEGAITDSDRRFGGFSTDEQKMQMKIGIHCLGCSHPSCPERESGGNDA